MRAAHAARSPLMVLLVMAAIAVAFHLVVVETSAIPLTLRPSFGLLCKLGFVTISAVTHWSIYASLLLAFGLTLRPGREPLITSMARRLHGEVEGELAAYTRGVTVAWTIFFAVQLILSITLFCFAPLVVWSFFVNILDIPLVIAMFTAE